MSSRVFFAWVGVFIFHSVALAAPPESVLEFTDLDGVKQAPLSNRDYRATVLFFVLPDCPISNANAPEIKRISTDYAQQKVASLIVYVDPDLSIDAAKKHASDFGFVSPVIRDTSLELVKKTGVTIAPEVAVLGPDGKRLYRGRINNLYFDYGKRRAKPTQHDLRDALDAILAGKPVPQETTTSIGCFITKPVTKNTSPQ